MTKNKLIYWLPRILSLLFVAFLSIFALDVFDEYQGLEVIVALLIHLIPSFVLLIVIAIAWKRELVGTVVFFVGAIYFVWLMGFDQYWATYLTIPGMGVLLAILYALSWKQKKRLTENSDTQLN